METEAFSPRVMYSPEGSTRRVDNQSLATALERQGWAFKPFPPPPEPVKPATIEEQIAKLTDLVMQHDALLMKRKGAKKDE